MAFTMSKTMWFIIVALMVPLIGFLIYITSPWESYQNVEGPVFPKREIKASASATPKARASMPAKNFTKQVQPKPVSSLQYLRAGPDILGSEPKKSAPNQNTKTSKTKKKSKKTHRKHPAPTPAPPPKPKLQLQTN